MLSQLPETEAYGLSQHRCRIRLNIPRRLVGLQAPIAGRRQASAGRPSRLGSLRFGGKQGQRLQ